MGIPIPSNKNKCKVILTSRSKSHCRINGVNMMTSTQFLEVAPLTEIEARNFFKMNLGRDLDEENAEIATHARDMVQRCGGIPLSLEVLGKAMAEVSSVDEWRKAVRILITSPTTTDGIPEYVIDLLDHGIPGPGQVVRTLPDESLSGREQIGGYLTHMNEFLDDKKARYLGIYGMGGVGKTTLLKIFNDYLVESKASRRFDHVIFITVSQSPQIEEIKRDIEKQRDGDLSSLMKKRFLLLLDDVWKKVNLEEMGIPVPYEANQCKVIMTGRSKHDCHTMKVYPEYGQSFEVLTLVESEAWISFKRIVGKNLDSEGGDIARLAKSVAKRCGGLPLAIEIIGSSMIDGTNSMWREAETNLSKFPNTKEDMENKVQEVLKFSFDMLKDVNIRNCLLYCCLFKEDEWISKDKLIDYWYAEGFLDYDHPASFHEARVRGDNNITALVSRSLLQNSGSYVKMHDVVLQTCLWLTSGKFNQYEKFCVYHEKDPDHTLSTTTLNNLQRLSIFANYHAPNQDGKDFLWELNLPDLHTLLCNGTPNRIPIEKINFENCKNLLVLQLRNCVLNFELKRLEF